LEVLLSDKRAFASIDRFSAESLLALTRLDVPEDEEADSEGEDSFEEDRLGIDEEEEEEEEEEEQIESLAPDSPVNVEVGAGQDSGEEIGYSSEGDE
jgi:hypothetical protein